MRRRQISNAELDILKTLWEAGRSTIRHLTDLLEAQGRTWAYTTVQTLLNRLEVKGYVKRDARGLAHVYRPAFSQKKLLLHRLRELAEQLCDGDAAPLVMALMDSRGFSREDIAELRRLLDRLDAQGTARAKPE